MDELILGKIASAKDQQTVLGVYNLIMLAPVGDGERLAIRGLDQDKVFGEYDVVVLNRLPGQQETLAALQLNRQPLRMRRRKQNSSLRSINCSSR